jgi:protein-arginine deiminase
MRTPLHLPITALLAVASAALAGCGSGNETPWSVALVADANRDGKVDPSDPGDTEDKVGWSATHGASFLANLDDDDGDKIPDCDDDKINGDADLADLARLVIVAAPGAPDGAAGKLTVDDASLEAVRVWKKGLDGTWAMLAGSVGACTGTAACDKVGEATLSVDEVRAGLELGIEGRRLRMSNDDAWSGEVTLTYRVLDKVGGKPLPTDDHADGVDTVKMRVAPWVLFGNLSPFDRVHAWKGSPQFYADLGTATTKGNVQLEGYSNWDDQWTQDFFQTAWTAIPGPDGVHGMRIANARPWGRGDGAASLPIAWLKKNYLGPDRGTLVIYKKADSGSTYDSHGNHDLLPPYEGNGKKWPLGRIVTGSGVLPETLAFYDAQPQGPHFQLVSNWLYVGHIDEFLSYVPAKTARGWKLLVASPRLARQMLLDAQKAGNGAVHMFVGKQKYVGESDNMASAEVSIDDALADADLMQWAQDAQAHIDENVAKLKAEIGLADADIIEIPTLFEELSGQKVAWNPGTVNMLVLGKHIVPPNPFGPVIKGVDIFKQDMLDRLGTAVNALGPDGQGLDVNFADDWDDYHILDGEVHCGSNPEASAPFADVKWWEVTP